MAKRVVVWTKSADLQFVGILEYWLKRNKSNSYSKKLIELVGKRTSQISTQPLIFKTADYKNTRVATLGNFSIYYKVSKTEIIVTAFWDNRQDPKKLLKILQKSK
jgi:hypothetical protein